MILPCVIGRVITPAYASDAARGGRKDGVYVPQTNSLTEAVKTRRMLTPGESPGPRCLVPITRLSRAASTTSVVATCSRLRVRMRSTCDSSRCRSRKLPPVMRMIAATASGSDMPLGGSARPISGQCSESSRRTSRRATSGRNGRTRHGNRAADSGASRFSIPGIPIRMSPMSLRSNRSRSCSKLGTFKRSASSTRINRTGASGGWRPGTAACGIDGDSSAGGGGGANLHDGGRAPQVGPCRPAWPPCGIRQTNLRRTSCDGSPSSI